MAEPDLQFFDLSHYGKIELAGGDARSFLHNLCTQDVKTLAVGASCEAFLTTTKARVVAHVWITHTKADVLRLDMVAGQADKVLKHLNHFLISEQVEIADRTAEFGMLRVVGPNAASASGGGKPADPRPHRLLAVEGVDLFCPSADVAALQQQLISAGVGRAGAETYERLRIEAGLPEYGIDIDENRLAMEVGRTAQAISYTKGCYLGQETIVMARDRGQVNRMLTGVRFASVREPVASGTKLFRGSDEVGQVTSSLFSLRFGQVIALAYLRRGSWDPGTEVVADGRPAVVCALPFRA